MNESWETKAIVQLRQRLNEEREKRSEAELSSSVMTVVAFIGWILFVTALCFIPFDDAAASESNNWAEQWVDGYLTGYCWQREECDLDSMDPVQIPYPENGETDGYIVGLRDGLKAGEQQ